MQPSDWICFIEDATDYYAEVEPQWTSINQGYADRHDARGLEDFHDAALRLCAGVDVYDRIRINERTALHAASDEMVDEAIALAATDPKVKAIYFEHDLVHCNRDSWFQLNAFLCTRFSLEADSDWPAHFKRDFEGPKVPCVDPDPESAFPFTLEVVSDGYVDAVLLGAVIRSVSRHSVIELPIAFAGHDRPIIYLNRNDPEVRDE